MKLKRSDFVMLISTLIIPVIMLFCGIGFHMGKSKEKRIAVDFSIHEMAEDEHKYSFLSKAISDYICNLSYELGIDSDLVVAILMVENPEFNPEVIHKNENGTVDCGLFQLNDRYIWTTFKDNYWVDNVEVDPFNWKHNCFIALHHINYLQEQLKVTDEAIMAYNCGIGAVMNNSIPPSTRIYLYKVKKNIILLKNSEN